MTRYLLATLALALTLPSLAISQTSLSPEWPRLYPDPVVAPGFRATGAAEFQRRDGRWMPTGRRQHAFDAAGRLTTTTHESEVNGQWRVSRRETFRYEGPRLVEAIVQESVGPSLRDRARHAYAYAGDHLVEERIDAWSFEGRWMPIRRTAYTVDAAGRRLREEPWTLQGSTGVESGRIESRHDAAGRLTEETKQRQRGGAWVDAERITRTYDPAGRPVEVVMQAPERGGAGWTDVFRIVHAYDAAGRRVAIVTRTLGREGLRDSARQVLEYDGDGNQIATRHQGLHDRAWTDARKETWTYERAPGGTVR